MDISMITQTYACSLIIESLSFYVDMENLLYFFSMSLLELLWKKWTTAKQKSNLYTS